MNIPNLPTDNLYKFIAVFGLIMLLASGIYPFSKIIAMENEKIAIEVEKQLLDVQVADLKSGIERARQAQKNGFPANISSLETELAEIQNKEIKLGGKVRLVNLLESEVRFLKTVGIIGACLGSLFMIAGFSCWYVLVQKWQDKALKNLGMSNPAFKNPRRAQ